MGASAGGQRLPSGGLAGQGGSTPTGNAQRQLGGGLIPGAMRPAVMQTQFPENRMPGYGGQGVQPAVMPPNRGTGYGGMGVQPAVMPPNPANTSLFRPQPQQPQMVQPTGPNIFQQSSGALNQAQRTLTGLSQFQPQPMQAATAGPTAIYKGATVERTTPFAEATVGPAATMQAAQLGEAERMQGVGAVQAAQAPEQIAVNQLATTDIGQYMSPYQQQVIEAGQADIERQRQLASENLAAQAQRAGAFGGSRQAVQEGVLAGEALRQAGQLSAQQRQRGFETALQSGQFDIGQTQAARTLASQQGFQAEQLGQQAREAAAAREQAARAGNMAAANQFAIQQAQFEQQAGQANMQAQNAMTQLQANLSQQAGLAGAAQDAARAGQQAGLTQAAGLASMGAMNTAAQQQAAREQAARQATFGGQFQGAGIRQGAASGLAGLGQQQFNMGQSIQQQQMQQGALQRGIMQGLIGAGQQNFGQYTGAPTGGLNTLLGGLTGAGVPTGQTSSFQPGFLNYLQTFASLR